MREDPTPGVETSLLVRLDDGADPGPVVDAVRSRGGTVDSETRFGNLHVAVTEPEVADLLAALPGGVAAVETVTSELSGDAGEDVDPDA